MDYFFKPRGIAVIGATPSERKGGRLIVSNLKKGYTGKVYPVNPRYREIEGFACYESVQSVPDPVDLAIIFVAARMVPEMVAACAKRGIPGVMIQSAGFSEIGEQGDALQRQTLQIAEETGIRIWGPNCMGLVDAVNRWVFSTVTPTLWDAGLIKGNVALIAQSGMLAGAFLIDLMCHGSMGISKVCSIGNKMDIDENDLLPFLIDDPDTDAIGLYLESLNDCRRLMAIARGARKPIVILNGGKTAQGASAALSHTASLSSSGRLISGAMAQAGIVEANGFYQLTDFCRTLAMVKAPRPESQNRVAVLTYTGAAGIVSADLMASHGLTLADLSSGTLEALQTVYPEWMPPSNPVDLWPGIILNGTQKAYGEAMRAVCADPGVDAVFAHCFVGGFALEPDFDMLAGIAKAAGKPLFCWVSGERDRVYHFQALAREAGVPMFREVMRAVECISVLLCRYPAAVRAKDGPAPTPDAGVNPVPEGPVRRILDENSGVLDEVVSKQVLAACDIPVVAETCVSSLSEARKAAVDLGFPLVVKGVLPGMAHKTESGLVHLGIDSDARLAAAVSALESVMDGAGRILLQRQLTGPVELLAGVVRDPRLGPCVMCGVGGVFAEALDVTVTGVAPLTAADALSMIDRLACRQIFDGYRGFDPVDKTALAGILVRLGDLAWTYPRIREIDINPLMVHHGIPTAVDALIVMD